MRHTGFGLPRYQPERKQPSLFATILMRGGLIMVLWVQFWIERAYSQNPEESIESAEASRTLYVAFSEDRMEVRHWTPRVKLHMELRGAHDVAWLGANIVCNENLRFATGGLVRPGPLYRQLEGLFGGFDPPLEAYSVSREGTATLIFGGLPILRDGQGIFGSGVFAEIELEVLKPGSGHVWLRDCTWVKAGSDRRLPASVLGSTRIQIVYERPRAFLSLGEAEDSDSFVPASTKRVRVGQKVSVYLRATDLNRVIGTRFSFSFDNRLLELVDIIEGDLVRETGVALVCFDSPDRINRTGRAVDQGLAFLEPGREIRGHGNLVRLDFLAQREGNGRIALDEVQIVSTEEPGHLRTVEAPVSDLPLEIEVVSTR